jgi:hypothetical protein
MTMRTLTKAIPPAVSWLQRAAGLLVVAAAFQVLGGCASMAAQRLAGDISHAMLNQRDPDIVRAGAPAYLLLLDGMIAESPDDRGLLIAAARLYGAYGSGLVADEGRRQGLSTQARAYGERALCSTKPRICDAQGQSLELFDAAIEELGDADLDALYVYGITWAGWIQSHSSDWNAVADLPKVEAVFERVTSLDPGYDRGRAQLYLAVMRTQLSPALGGNPETGRRHFEEAIRYSKGRDLMAKLEFARRYGRLKFDQSLHDRLLNEVLAADPVEPDLTLSNVLAQAQARVLLADGYFDD